jgi:two-component system nitrogen regulation sensor histidine kinase GlnL
MEKDKESRLRDYERILDSQSTANLVFDHRLRLKYINLAGTMLFEVSSRQLWGTAAHELLRCPGRSVQATLRQALKTAQPFTQRGMELPISEARTITVDCIVTPLQDGDVTQEVLVELIQVDRRLRISREEQLMSQNSATRALLRGLAHEIKNPLGGLRGAAQLLERELGEEGLQEYTRVIIAEADRLKGLVNRMLGPSHPLRKQPLNIHQVLQRVRTLAQAEVPPGVALRSDYDPSIPPLFGDLDQLIQAFLNIVRNATQAVGRQGRIILRSRVQRQFTIGYRCHPLVVRAEIIDDGPGIPPHIVDQIFLPMVTGSGEGSGLGLSIAQFIIHQHGGLIECSSVPGNTVFTVFLPLESSNDERRASLGHRR